MWIIDIVHRKYANSQIQQVIADNLLENGSFKDERRKSEINKEKVMCGVLTFMQSI